ncbi:uncharacterized protein LDX57_006715 [Aspergillus melleus]|uniref:uncharacterized protein n=1 Tax=Aspergillus melleus TaxID=138277 RepID=UPI001E8DBEDA|nr:uncharacterized protein LDX57_006715 [Aspergillus melleus]KAH8429044.1 hypothetical protein LDX57_006715 [Aspergillus melleus]
MTFNITIGPSPHASDHSISDEEDTSGIQDSPPPDTGRRVYEDPYDEWADIPYPDKLKPSDSVSRPRTSYRLRTKRTPYVERRRTSMEERRRSRQRDAAPIPESPPSVSTHRDEWLICSGDNDKDITVHVDLDVGLDINHYLDRLARLCRLGHFTQGVRLFEERLVPHVDFFPVVAEYADLLLEQESFGRLHEFISGRLLDPYVNLSDEEVLLLKTLRSLAGIHTRGALIPALEMTAEALDYLTGKSPKSLSKSTTVSGLKIQLMEACVRIIAYAAAHSNFLETEPFQSLLHWSVIGDRVKGKDDDKNIKYLRYNEPKSTFDPSQSESRLQQGSAGDNAQSRGKVTRQNYPRMGGWYHHLVSQGFLWESHRILRAVLPLLGGSDGNYIVNGGFEEFVQLDDISKAGKLFHLPEEGSTDEQLLLTEFANASLLASFLAPDSSLETVRTAHKQFYKKSHTLASTILSAHPYLVNSRPYLNWVSFECTRGLRADSQLQLPVNQQRPISEIWSQGVLSRVQFLQQNSLLNFGQAELKKAHGKLVSYQSLEIVSASAKELGDYKLERSVLEKKYQSSHDSSESLQVIRDLARLHRDTRQDISGYLQCLVDEYLLLTTGNSTDRETMRQDLQRRLSEFDSAFPFRFDYDATAHRNLAIVFFDNPLLKWMERRVWYPLLKSLGRDVEAEVARVQLPSAERYLPKHILSQMNPLTQSPVVELDKRPDPAPGTSVPERNNPNRTSRAILQEGYRSDGATDDGIANLEKALHSARCMKKEKEAKERDEKEKEDQEQERQMLEEKLAEAERERRSAEKRASAAEAGMRGMLGREQRLLILKDPVGRTFVFPFDQCSSIAAMKELMQQTFLDDPFLSPYIAKGDYEFTDFDGKPISQDDWASVIQPGGTITMHSKTKPEEKIYQGPEKEDLEPEGPRNDRQSTDEGVYQPYIIEESDEELDDKQDDKQDEEARDDDSENRSDDEPLQSPRYTGRY